MWIRNSLFLVVVLAVSCVGMVSAGLITYGLCQAGHSTISIASAVACGGFKCSTVITATTAAPKAVLIACSAAGATMALSARTHSAYM
ncbi:hypothetical protein CPC08DRAFT_716130 [Agrocybe pediades]|nr:hypothetical protein CPC08DRAFT_716130 [Agrocybe pediades]